MYSKCHHVFLQSFDLYLRFSLQYQVIDRGLPTYEGSVNFKLLQCLHCDEAAHLTGLLRFEMPSDAVDQWAVAEKGGSGEIN